MLPAQGTASAKALRWELPGGTDVAGADGEGREVMAERWGLFFGG